jgi:hypothetical protein
MVDFIQVREWDPEAFHRRVLELEMKGYLWQRRILRQVREKRRGKRRAIGFANCALHACA